MKKNIFRNLLLLTVALLPLTSCNSRGINTYAGDGSDDYRTDVYLFLNDSIAGDCSLIKGFDVLVYDFAKKKTMLLSEDTGNPENNTIEVRKLDGTVKKMRNYYTKEGFWRCISDDVFGDFDENCEKVVWKTCTRVGTELTYTLIDIKSPNFVSNW